jgi:uncharacterized membrane protein SpoIIM required for sporulation
MDQDLFVRKKAKEWKDLDELLTKLEKGGARSMPFDELKMLGTLYRRACADLAFARSHGYDSTLVEHLNASVGKAYGELYRNEPFTIGQIVRFYTIEFPLHVRKNGVFILAAALVFLVSLMVVFWLVHTKPERAHLFVPHEIIQGYEQSTGERRAGEERSLTDLQKSAMSHRIMTNNIMVGIKSFATGIFLGFGTLYFISYNGALVGALAALAAHYGDNLVFWSLILPHGVLELMAIFICGGAGFLLAFGLVSPGHYSRLDSLRSCSIRAAHLMLGAVAMFVIAAIIEGFLTPLDVSPWLKLIFSGALAMLQLHYFMRRRKEK